MRVTACVSKTMKVPDSVHERATELAEAKDMTKKEAVRFMCRDTEGYDV